MKRYIPAILIPCLLMQFFGCYSTKYLSNEELRHYYAYSPITIITNDGRKLFIKKNVTVDEIENDSSTIFCSDFYWLDDNLILSKNRVALSNQKDLYGSQIRSVKTETLSLSKDMISTIFVSKYNSTGTILLSGIAVIAIIVGIIYVSQPKIHLNLE